MTDESPILKERVEIMDGLLQYFEGDVAKAYAWLRTKNLNFGGFSPMRLINMGKGQKVIQFIKDQKEGNIP